MEEINYTLIIVASLIATSSPGPATLAIAAMSMDQGRWHGFSLASGVLTGSVFWSALAAFGLGTIMYTNAWLFEFMRYLGALYLLFLSYRSFCSALKPKLVQVANKGTSNYISSYTKGFLIHLTNPKAILFFGSIYTLSVPSGVKVIDLISVIATLGCVSTLIFLGYAFLFSSSKARTLYIKSRRFFDSIFSIFFGMAGVKLWSSKLAE